MYRADLHCHSTCSDGTCAPLELLKLAKQRELSGLSITDHDTLDAYTDELFMRSKSIGVQLFIGVEFSTRHKGHPVHVLGYGVRKTEEILAFCQRHQERRLLRNRAILDKLQRFSFSIQEEELGSCKKSTIGRPHIAEALLKKGYTASIKEAFDRYIGEGKPCFVPGKSISPEETIEVIHSAGGKAFIAHPHVIRKRDILSDLYHMNFDGLECYYGLFQGEHEEKWRAIAAKKGWLVSGGSDFHGSIKPHIQLGCSWVNRERITAIFGGVL